MQPLNIPIEITAPATGMAQALFHELAQQLELFVERGTTHTVDLFSLPLSEGDKQELESLLGKGEVDIKLTTVGESQIFETAYSGIWWVKHFAVDGLLISEFLEVSWIPEIIKTHEADLRLSLEAMKKIISKDERGEE